ncbi:MAG TPA: LacI family DNA-binding transcriptional regulator [Opitutaceae bacterium]|nr:LacI family DNA-binding transcriptional regulator [Opitutaceae bacterium]
MQRPTLRSIAHVLGISHATVSCALRGSPLVNQKTAQRVLQTAKKMGYRTNPLASEMMGELRRSQNTGFHGTFAAVDIFEPDRPAYAVMYHAALVEGARKRAAELGFKMETFVIGKGKVPLEKLDDMLRARHIHGLLVLPAWNEPNVSALDFSQYAAIYTDYSIEHPALHSVCPDHYRSMMMVLERLRMQGYRSPGLFVNKHMNERIKNLWEAALVAFQSRFSGIAEIPTLNSTQLTQEEFGIWFNTHNPDVVIGHQTHVIGWLHALGASVPDTNGFVCLNVLMNTVPAAGLDLQPRLIGARAAEMLADQLYRNERGVPETASTTTIIARWADGPTLRTTPI